jgi:hypothetical protein
MQDHKWFDYRRQKFQIYCSGISVDDFIRVYSVWRERYYNPEKITRYADMVWNISVKTNEEANKISSIDKDIKVLVTDNEFPMVELFKTFPILFHQYIHVLMFKPIEPPKYWNKILMELYLTKQINKFLRYIRPLPVDFVVCTGKQIKQHPRILKRVWDGKIKDMFSANAFKKMI